MHFRRWRIMIFLLSAFAVVIIVAMEPQIVQLIVTGIAAIAAIASASAAWNIYVFNLRNLRESVRPVFHVPRWERYIVPAADGYGDAIILVSIKNSGKGQAKYVQLDAYSPDTAE